MSLPPSRRFQRLTAKGALGGYLGEHDGKNVQGETQHKLDVLAHEVIIRSCEWGGLLAGMVSEELEHPYPVPVEYARGRYLLVFDPLRRFFKHRCERIGRHDLLGVETR